MEEKEIQDSSKYKKLEDKKYKKGITLKRFILLVFAIVMILILIIGIRWKILYNMQEEYNVVSLKDNWYYCSDSEDTIMNVYRKGTIWKMNTKQKNGEGNLTFWKDTSTGESLIFYENPEKKYAKVENGFIPNLQPSSFSANDNNSRLLTAVNPVLWIGTDKYDDIDCYTLEIGGQKEYIDKSTGLQLAIFQDNKQIRSIEYEFGEVTDEDVAKPDLSQYEYME